MNKGKAVSVAPKTVRPPTKRTLFEFANSYQNFAVGEKVTRTIWRRPDCYWTITKVKPKVLSPGMKPRGSAWGVLTWRGIPEGVERKIRGGSKKEWRTYDPKWLEQFKNENRWIQNQHLIGGAPPLPIVLQDPTKIPVLEQRFRLVTAYDEDFEEAKKQLDSWDQKLLFKSPDAEKLVMYYPRKRKELRKMLSETGSYDMLYGPKDVATGETVGKGAKAKSKKGVAKEEVQESAEKEEAEGEVNITSTDGEKRM